MNENITPLPWKVGFSDGSGEAYITAEHDVTVVCGADDGWGVPQGVGTAADAAYIVTAVNAYPALTARVKELEEALSKVERECRAITSEMAWDASDGRPSEAYVRTRFSDAANSINAVFDRAALNKEPTT